MVVIMHLLTLGLIFLCTGCAQFRLNNVPQISQLPPLPPTAHQQDIAYNLNGFDAAAESKLYEALLESGYFTAIYRARRGDIICIDATLNYETTAFQNLIFAVLTGFTFYIVPSCYTDTLTLTARVTSPSKHEVLYSYSDGTRHWQGLIFVPFMFTNQYLDTSPLYDVAKNMFKCLILDMRRDGFLGESASP